MNTPSVNPVAALMPAFLRSLGAIAADPALGYRGSSLASSLIFAATALEKGVEAASEFKELADHIKQLADSDTAPVKQEFYDWHARAQAAEMLFNPVKPEVPPGGEPTAEEKADAEPDKE